MELGRFSLGMGDRFGREGAAQLDAVMAAGRVGADLTPVWNKSNREHTIVGTTPADTRAAADAAERQVGRTVTGSCPRYLAAPQFAAIRGTGQRSGMG